ncbi:MAG: ATP-binding protein, partial [Nitrososphaerales archaeon]
LVGTLISAASVARRDSRLVTKVTPTAASAAKPTRLSQGVLFDQLLCTLAALAQQQPLLLLFDDLHWVDDATAAFLLHLGRELHDSPILVAGAYRSATVALGRRDPRSGNASRHPMAEVINELRRVQGEILIDLDRADGRAFVEAYVDMEPNRLGAAFRDALYAHTGGHALFTVESLRNLQARGELYQDEAGRWVAAESLDWGALPARVEAAIAERIDRLPEREHRILAAASVQGDDFIAEITAELARLPAAEVLDSLSSSLARQHHLVKPEGLAPAAAEASVRSLYRFTHHLFQKYLYDQLDPVERAQWHGDVAVCLDRQVTGNRAKRERLAERLAWHYEAAYLPLQAARALLDAGNRAMRVAAFREALARYDHGLALLAAAPPSVDRTAAEWTETARLLEVARLGPERVLNGLAGADIADALARATRAWAPQADEAPASAFQGWPQLRMLMAQTEYLLAAGELEQALAAAEQLGESAAQSGVEEFAGVAQFYMGAIRFALGDARESEQYLGRMLDWLTPGLRTELRAATGLDLLANQLGFSALNAWFLGYPETSLARSRAASAAARADGASVGEAAATALGAALQFLLRGPEASAATDGAGGAGPGLVPGELTEHAERCRALCVQQGLQMWCVFAEVMLGRVMVLAGEDLAGIDRIRDAGWRGAAIKILTDLFTVVLADSCLLAASRGPGNDGATRHDLLTTGLAAIDEKLGPARIPSYQVYEAELHRLKGELLLARDGPAVTEEALACFRRALELARDKAALPLELRAAMSVVRLLERVPDGRAGELQAARGALREVYGRFTEGFAVPDLREAAALLRGDGPTGEDAR